MRFPFFSKAPPAVTRKIQGTNNELRIETSKLDGVLFDIIGSGNTIDIAQSNLTGVKFFLRGDNHKIVIGPNCRFNTGSTFWFEDNNCSLIVGENTTGEVIHIAVTEPNSSMTIGKDCMFAYAIDLRTGDSHAILDAGTGKRINPAKNIVIGDHVWVAAHCVILKGVTIASNSVVATGSIVTKQFLDAGVLLAGNPAKVVKTGITWTRERTVGK